MRLREALEAIAGPDPVARNQGAQVLLDALRRCARSAHLAPRVTDDAVSLVAYRVLQRVQNGVPAVFPTDDAALTAYLKQALVNASKSHHRKASHRREVVVEADTPGAPLASALHDAELAVHHEQESAREEAALKAQVFREGAEAVHVLAQRMLDRRKPRYRAETMRLWHELLDFASGRALDTVIEAAGETPDAQSRNRRYTGFKRLREGLLQALDDQHWSEEKQILARAFIEQVLTYPSQVSGLEALRLSMPGDDAS